MWELTHLLERWVQFPPLNLPDERAKLGALDRAQLRQSAEGLRIQWGIELDVPFPCLTRTAEANGVIVVFATFANDDEVKRVSAFSTSKLSRPIIVTPPDRVDDVFRHRFNLAHELGNLVLHREEAHSDIEIEREADAFAGELTLPEKAMRSILRTRVEWKHIAKLSQTWGVDMKALIYRSRQLGLLSDASAHRAYQRLGMMRTAGLVKPTNMVPVVIESAAGTDTVERRVELGRWSLVPPWAKEMKLKFPTFNARTEDIMSKSTWKGPVKFHRAIVPVSGYFEWKTAADGTQTPFYIHPPDGETMALAGLYSWWPNKSLPEDHEDFWTLTATILTSAAVDELVGIHDRNPVPLPRDWWDDWLNPELEGDQSFVDAAVAAALPVASSLDIRQVAPLKGDGPELIEAI